MPKILITPESLKVVLKIIDTWQGKLSWSLLCENVSLELGIEKIERQSLAAYEVIQQSYSKRKEELRNNQETSPKVSDDVTVEYLKKQVDGLQAENSRLKKLNDKYKERFILWQYNAYKNGLRVSRLDDVEDVLSKPLISVERAKGG
jgi:regulator of replication initiation timing